MTMPDYKGQRDLLDRIVPRTCLGGLILAGIAFLSLMLCGSPAIIDGAYATMDHGQPVLAIGRLLYLYLTCCERLLFPCGLTAFASLLLARTHTLYRVQHPSASEQGTSPQS